MRSRPIAYNNVGMMTMMKMTLRSLLLIAPLCGLTLVACSEGTPDDAPAAEATAMPDAAAMVRAEVARTIEIAGEKMVALAEAMPQEAYAWRPAEGVRSVSEVYMHVAGTNYWFPTLVGGMPPESSGVTAAYNTVPPMEQVTDKAAVVATLSASFEYLVDFVANAPADRLDEAIDMFGSATTVRGVLVETTIHLHEHLGQSIAYARTNGVTPPWSG